MTRDRWSDRGTSGSDRGSPVGRSSSIENTIANTIENSVANSIENTIANTIENTVANTIEAPAKLTLSLRITGVRNDGYHLIDAEMVSVDLVDSLAFVVADDEQNHVENDLPDTGRLEIALVGGATRGLPVVDAPDNLIRRALRAVNRRAHVHVTKRIPAGGGLGGGSTNAAAVLRWAGRTAESDLRVATSLGADVPFCVHGGRARVTGIGEQIASLPYVEQTFTLLTPPYGVSTPAVYRAWDDLGGPIGESGNDLEAAAISVEPRLAEAKRRLEQWTNRRPVLAGSGSTWFVEGAFPGPDVVVVRTLPSY